jgi:MOSC domain-containing protein YiiM
VTATVVQLAISRGGVPKHAILEAHVTRAGIAGDVQRNRRLHGGPDRALCLFALEVIERLRGEGHPIAPGSAGENITIRGLDWASLGPGSRLGLGDQVVVEVTALTVPCKQIAGSFVDGDFRRLLPRGHARLYARVLVEGTLRPGDAAVVMA